MNYELIKFLSLFALYVIPAAFLVWMYLDDKDTSEMCAGLEEIL